MTVPDTATFEALVDRAQVGLCVVRDERIVYANPRLAALFGYSVGELRGLAALSDLVQPSDRAAVGELMSQGSEAGVGSWVPARGLTKPGTLIDVEIHATSILATGSRAHAVTIRDASDREQIDAVRRALTDELDAARRKLTEIIHIDQLTGLPNRAGLERLLRSERKRAVRNGSRLSAIMVDCDGLRRINEAFGPAVGDLALVEVGQRLAPAVRGCDQVARMGGDEFMALLPDTGIWQAEEVAQRIGLKVCASPILRAPQSVSLTVSTAALQLSVDTTTVEEEWSRAALALRHRKMVDKRSGSTGEDPADANTRSNLQALDQLSRQQCYRTLRQPICDLDDESVWAYELLTRTTVRNFESPGDFLRLAQENNILILVDLLCLRAGVRAAAASEPAERYHVNLFPSTILNTPTADIVDILSGLPDNKPHCIELNEQQFFGDNRQLKGRLTELQESGFEIGLDDVGFGRTSLELLILLEPDLVKIDRQFVAGIGSDQYKRAAFRRLLDIVDATGARAVVEGLEHQDDLKTAQDLGARLGQGYFLGRPAPTPSPHIAS